MAKEFFKPTGTCVAEHTGGAEQSAVQPYGKMSFATFSAEIQSLCAKHIKGRRSEQAAEAREGRVMAFLKENKSAWTEAGKRLGDLDIRFEVQAAFEHAAEFTDFVATLRSGKLLVPVHGSLSDEDYLLIRQYMIKKVEGRRSFLQNGYQLRTK